MSVMVADAQRPYRVLGALSLQRHAFDEQDVHVAHAIAIVLVGSIERVAAERCIRDVRDAERASRAIFTTRSRATSP